MSRSRIATIALAIALLAAVWSLVLLATGGFDVTLVGVVITAHDVTRPAALGLLAAVVSLVARGPGTVAAALTARARGIDRGLARLRVPDRLSSWMATTGDPRATNDDDRFDRYPYYGPPLGTSPRAPAR